MKLSSFCGSNILIITQSNHGASQSNCAFDFGWQGTNKLDKSIYAPCDGSTGAVVRNGQQSYFFFNGDGFSIIFVHDLPIREGSFKRGEKLGESQWDHHHVAIKVNGGWRWIFDYLDRNIDLSFWTYGSKNSKWAQWASYPTDLQLPEPAVDPTIELKNQITQLTAANQALQARIAKVKAALA